MQLPQYISLDYLKEFSGKSFSISSTALEAITQNRLYLEQQLNSGNTFYGINTGFGSLCDVRIDEADLAQLQENLVKSHACGLGDEVPEAIVRLMLLLKVHGLSQGYSGIRVDIVQRLTDFYNLGISPVVYELGSLGASGDLAPLAHLCLPILGFGKVNFKGTKMEALEALRLCGLEPLALAAKEGLALLNGTQFMSSYLTHTLLVSQNLLIWADLISALSVDGFDAKNEPFQSPIHRVRPHKGQLSTAKRLMQLLEGSAIQRQKKEQVQDPYSFRCIPQVHGATKDVAERVGEILTIEINSVTDNPIVFNDEDAIMSGGNFHGQILALHADFLAIAMAEIANISERRTYLLISGQRGLPPFLAPNAGLNSGFMIAQYTAAAIVSQNKQYCTPASVDSIVSSNGQEDHVSMGANAVTKLWKVVQNVKRILAIELLTAAQALDFRHPILSSPILEYIWSEVRSATGFMANDEILHNKMKAVEGILDRDAEQIMNQFLK